MRLASLSVDDRGRGLVDLPRREGEPLREEAMRAGQRRPRACKEQLQLLSCIIISMQKANGMVRW